MVTSPELIRKRLNAAIPKPDTPRRSAASESQGSTPDSTGGEEGGGQGKLLPEVSPRGRESEPKGGRLEESDTGGDVEQSGETRRRQSK